MTERDSVGEARSEPSLMDKWDVKEAEIIELQEKADEQLRTLLQRLSQWVDMQRDLSVKTEKGTEKLTTINANKFVYQTTNNNGKATELIVEMDTRGKDKGLKEVKILELRKREETDTRPIDFAIPKWSSFISFTEFRYTKYCLRTVKQMRRATNAVKHSTSTEDVYIGRIDGIWKDDTYGYFNPWKYKKDAFLRRRHSNLLNRTDPLQEGSRILGLLSNAKLVCKISDRIEKPIEVVKN